MRELFSDERGVLSSKRLLGFICVVIICVVALAVTFLPDLATPPEYLINTLCLLSFGLLGLSSIDKFSQK